MATLDFKGPFHFDEIYSKSGSKRKFSGIYIWGFMYEIDSSDPTNLGNPIDFTKNAKTYNYETMQMLPFYVGQGGDVFDRLESHHDTKCTKCTHKWHAPAACKYIRFSKSYLKLFSKDNPKFDFPIYSKKQEDQLLTLLFKDPTFIEYSNYASILNTRYGEALNPKPIAGDNPITNWPIIKDTNYELVDLMDNFWFCYAELEEDKPSREDHEAFTFFSLKGKTTSKTKSCPSFNGSILINDSILNPKIFKKWEPQYTLDRLNKGSLIPEIGQVYPAEKFPGYKK